MALVVSGGHTHLYLARPSAGSWHYTLVGRTLDDAAGEAYDKVAKLLGLGYPGGPWLDALAPFGNPRAVPFAFSRIKTKLHLAGRPPRTKAAVTAPIAHLDPRFLFSFSGIKTAVLRYVELHNLRPEAGHPQHRSPLPPGSKDLHVGSSTSVAPPAQSALYQGTTSVVPQPVQTDPGALAPEVRLSTADGLRSPGAPGLDSETWETTNPTPPKPPQTKEEALALCSQQTLDLIASFQHAVVGDLLKKTFAAAESLGVSRILVTGGVAANRELRARFTAEAARRHVSVACPTLALSTDNAAMIAAAAWPRFLAGDFAQPDLSASPSLALGR